MGSCFYSVGWQCMPMGSTGATRAAGRSSSTSRARPGTRRAGSRSTGSPRRRSSRAPTPCSASRSGAAHYDWAAGLIEFVAVGTAVVSERYDFGEEIFLSSLSGQEFASLVRRGWLPVGIAAGSTVAYVVGGVQTMQALSGYGARWQNQELTELTQGLYAARSWRCAASSGRRASSRPPGIVGVQIEQRHQPRELEQQGYKRLDLIVTMHVIGTAIAPIDEPDEPPPTYIALALNEETR